MIIEKPEWIVRINGSRYEVGRVSITKDYTALTDVATVEITETLVASPALGLALWIDLGDRVTEFSYPVFRGYVQAPVAVAEPNSVTVAASGRLSRLRTSWSIDRDFTGETDGFVVLEALDESEVVFDVANIQDAGLILGPKVDFKASKDTSCRGLPQELNRVLYMVLTETGGVVERFHYSLIADAEDIVETFTAGVDLEIYSDTRTRGPIDEIINKQVVTGVNFPCGSGDPPECNCTVWGKASGSNDILGARNRAEPGQESSPAIQTSAHAGWLAKRRLEESNRVKDEVVVGVHLNPRLRILDTIGISDDSPGVGLTEPALVTPGVIRRIEINDFTMTLSVVLGEAGPIDSSSDGIDKQCNNTSSTGAGDGDEPDFGPWPRVEIPEDPWVPPDYDATTPFFNCETTEMFDCDPLTTEEDQCLPAAAGIDSCTGVIPEGVTPCLVEGWHKSEYPDAGETYDCQCKIDTNLFYTGNFQDIHFLTDDSGEVQRVGLCSDPGDLTILTATFDIALEVTHDDNIFDHPEDVEPRVYEAQRAIVTTGTVCVDFDYMFCGAGQSITATAVGVTGGEVNLTSIHDFTVYSVPGHEVFNHISVGGSFFVNSATDHVGMIGISDPEHTPPHHSFGLAHSNSGGSSIGSGIPLNTEMHATVCWEMSGDYPVVWWNNGIESGYGQALPFIDEDHHFPGEPLEQVESSGHEGHVVSFVLNPGDDQTFCTDDCPGVQVWGFLVGASTCEENEGFNWPGGDPFTPSTTTTSPP